jgi:(R,R)-butanediol dehydrogenase/meso-butanediol dehydrogenase/diacetyl reductase
VRAVRLHGVRDLRVEDVPEPALDAPDAVKVRVACAGICGSDLHNFATGIWMSRTPSTPGHEFAGEVVEIGPEATGFAVGDRVVADSRVPCGACPACLAGRGYLCPQMGFVGEVNDGGFAPVTVQPAHQLRKLPDPAVPWRVAAMAEPLAVALHAANRLKADPGETVLVVGAGPIGALAALALAHRGQARVLIADLNRARRDRVAEATGAIPVDLDALTDKPGAAIDATGAPAATNATLGAVARGGSVALVGLYHGAPSTDLNAIVEGGLTISGCAAFDSELDEAVALLAPLSAPLLALSEEPAPLDAAPALYADLAGGRTSRIKALLAP